MTSGTGSNCRNLSATRENLDMNNFTMKALPRCTLPLYTPILHPKHTNRIRVPYASPIRLWTRSFHASASYRVDLAFDLHDNNGKAKGAPILILHGLFGSKRNNRSISKFVALLFHLYRMLTRDQSPRARSLPSRLRPRPTQPWRLVA
jgi:hypothetical protein